jgi:4a-hydroxytetrahydrobiopterin dehydratase
MARHSRDVAHALTAEQVDDRLRQSPGWSGDTSALRRNVEFPDFPTAIAAVGEIAQAAEQMDHHPDMHIRWRTVTFTLSTHSAGGVTSLDFDLARRISDIAGRLAP